MSASLKKRLQSSTFSTEVGQDNYSRRQGQWGA